MTHFNNLIDPDRQTKLLLHMLAATHTLVQGGKTVDALQLLLDAAVDVTGAERGLMIGMDPEQWQPGQDPFEAAFIHVNHEMEKELLEGDGLAPARLFIEGVVESGRLQVVEKVDVTNKAAVAPATMLAAPMRMANRAVGVLYLDHTTATRIFNKADCSAVEYLAGQAAQAIQNGLLAKKLSEVTQEKAKFVSVVTHELRIPMTSIKGYTEMLKKGMAGPVNDMQAEFLKVIANNVERMSVLVSDLSDLSHAESGRLTLQITSVALVSSIREVAKTLMPRMEEKSQTLVIDVPEDLPAVSAEPARVAQVLSNLLNNANKYTPSGGKISITARPVAEGVKVEVTDTGIGISPEDQQHLFTQFFRSDDPDVREQQGWGLGLSISKRLIEMMQGEIGAQSTLKQGSTFWFTLPRAGVTDG